MKLKRSTCALLLLLRLCIGWHLLIEGLAKLDSLTTGPTSRGSVWSSKPYLLESSGPFAAWFRNIPGDPDEEALTLLRPPPGQLEPQLPPALQAQWQTYLQRWETHYGLSPEQTAKAQEVFTKHCQEVAIWFHTGVKDVVRTYPTGAVTVKKTTPTRLTEYESALKAYRELQYGLDAFNRDVWKDRLKLSKGEVAALRTDLLKDLEDKTAQLNRNLRELLTSEQRTKGPFVPEQVSNRLLWLTDVTTAWGLTVAGAMLLVGLFTRLACVGGAGLLLLFYLAMPPLPWLPENPKAEGHYLLINKTLIEIVALGLLATLPTGQWLGLDAVIGMIFRRKAVSHLPPAS